MNRDNLEYVAVSIMSMTAVLVAIVIGALRNNPNAILAGIVIGVYAVVVGTSTSVKRELKKEIKEVKDQIRNLQSYSRAD
jgi:branched-subunit amino acid ABC-type transport system permease component